MHLIELVRENPSILTLHTQIIVTQLSPRSFGNKYLKNLKRIVSNIQVFIYNVQISDN